MVQGPGRQAAPHRRLPSPTHTASGLQAQSSQVGGRLPDGWGLLSVLQGAPPAGASRLPILAGSPSPSLPLHPVACVPSQPGGLWQFDKVPRLTQAPAPRAAVGRQEGGGEPRGPRGQVLSESMSISALGTELDRDRGLQLQSPRVLQGTQGQHHRKDKKGKGLNQPAPPTPRPKVR